MIPTFKLCAVLRFQNPPTLTDSFQLELLKASIDEKHPILANRNRVAFHQNDAKHMSPCVPIRKNWHILARIDFHLTYSSVVAYSYYHLFRLLQNPLKVQNFNSLLVYKKQLGLVSPLKNDGKLYRSGNIKLSL